MNTDGNQPQRHRSSPPRADEQPIPTPRPPERFHDLDALRAFAMLAGIALHSAVPFVPYWRADSPGAGLLGGVYVAIHGFRMPLFFFLSGFFTTMLCERKGIKGLLMQRVKRVGLPLLLACLVILPLVPLGLLEGMQLAGNPPAPPDPQAGQGFRLAHLWFLWMLLLFVGLFALLVSVARHLPAGLRSPAVWGVILLTIVAIAQSRMTNDTLGPDTSEGLIPVPHVFIYYGCFFAWGALVFGRTTPSGTPLIRAMGHGWQVTLAAGMSAFVVVMHVPLNRAFSSALQITYAVLLTCSLLGLTYRFFASNSHHIRWLSDSSYWLYLAHLPLVLVAQGLALRWHVPPLVAFPMIFVSVTALLLVTYRYGVRYTPIGTLLNGQRSRVAARS